MSSVKSPQVLIVGSGPAGLIVALSLLKNGIPVRIIEKNAEHLVAERGAGVSPRTLEIEHFLGVGDEVQRSGLEWPSVHVFDLQDPHRIVKTFKMMEKMEPTPAFPVVDGVMIGQWRHQQIFREHIEALGCQVELCCALSGFEQQDDGVVVRLTKTTNGEQIEESAKFAYVIGADGGRSVVRKQLGVNFVGESREDRIYLVDARVEGMKVEKSGFYRWGQGTKNIVFLRTTIRAGVFQLVISAEIADFELLKTGTPEAVESEFHKITGRTDLKITEIISHSEWRPNMRIAERFHDKRVFIVGDAAHVHSPTGGQGLNSSIQDSFNLAWKLALVMKNQAPATLLDSYQHERVPVIAQMLNLTTDLYNKVITRAGAQKAIEEAAKDTSSGKEKGDPALIRGRKLFQLDINCRWSEVVFDERFGGEKDSSGVEAYGVAGHDVRAGDRAPDAPGLIHLNAKEGDHTVTRLFEIFSPSSHTALIFSSNPTDTSTRALLEPLTKLPANLIHTVLILPTNSSSIDSSSSSVDFAFQDSEGHAYKDYEVDAIAKQPTVVIIRPDAMIGAFATSAVGVEKYLSTVFSSV